VKIVFLSNFLNHHQTVFCEALENIAGKGNFTFLASERIDDFRLEMGYSDINESTDYVLCVYDSNENFIKAKKLIADCDLLIATGGCPDEYIEEYNKRMISGKISFSFGERVYKINYKRFYPKGFLSFRKKHTLYKKYNSYLLCASSYAAKDYAFFGAYKNKAFKFGYFPDTKIEPQEEQAVKGGEIRILWVGRLITLKRCEIALYLAEYLKKMNINFTLEIVGSGDRRQFLENLSKKIGVDGKVDFCGSMPIPEVRKKMRQSDIFLFTSNRQEGWGAVLNESMSDGCAVVSSAEAGATNYLIKDGYNGIVFSGKHPEKMYERVLELCNDRDEIKRLGENASKTMQELWNAEAAAKRLVKVYEQIKEGRDPFIYSEGPLSKAD